MILSPYIEELVDQLRIAVYLEAFTAATKLLAPGPGESLVESITIDEYEPLVESIAQGYSLLIKDAL